MATILCIDDDSKVLELHRSVLGRSGYTVLTALDGLSGIALTRTHHIDAVVLDFAMAGMDGNAVAEALMKEQPKLPVVVWIHGGPLNSWNSWHWRWNPWLLVERVYAVLLPDPALSTGYGQAFVERGRGRWGDEPFTDLMAATDAAEARDDIDETRTAAMGGSFGGYMANWVAGHTDRFRAIVTHASLWMLDGFGRTTDYPAYWRREMTSEAAARNSPHRHVGAIRTPSPTNTSATRNDCDRS